MTELQQTQFTCSGDLENIVIWGIRPMRHLCKFMDTYVAENLDMEDEDVMTFFVCEFRNKLDDIEEAIFRFINTMRKRQGKAPFKEKGTLEDLIQGQGKAPDTGPSSKDSSGA